MNDNTLALRVAKALALHHPDPAQRERYSRVKNASATRHAAFHNPLGMHGQQFVPTFFHDQAADIIEAMRIGISHMPVDDTWRGEMRGVYAYHTKRHHAAMLALLKWADAQS